MACSISALMVLAGYARVMLFGYSGRDALAISCSLLAIVLSSVIIGCTLPLLLHRLELDPAHAGATIQVIMDLAGVLITCMVCSVLLRSEVLTLDAGVPHEFHHISSTSTKAAFSGRPGQHEGRPGDAGWEVFDRPEV